LFVSDQEQYILIACDSKIEEEAIQNRVYARDVAHSERCVSRKKAVVEIVGVMECVTESNTCATSRKGITEINIGIASRKGCHGNREACVMESVVVGVMS